MCLEVINAGVKERYDERREDEIRKTQWGSKGKGRDIRRVGKGSEIK